MTIAEALRTSVGKPPVESQWLAAFELLAAHEHVLSSLQSPAGNVLRMNAAIAAIGRASVELEQEGFSFVVTEKGELDLNETEREKLGKSIDALASSIGGRHIVDWTFHVLVQAKKYDNEFERWGLTRTSDNFQGSAPEPQIPWGYLYQLGIKHFHAQGDANEKDFRKLLLLVRNGTTIMNVQPYSGMEGMILDAKTLMPFLLESVVYDSLFTFSQFPARHAEQLVDFLAKELVPNSSIERPSLHSVTSTAMELLRAADALRPKIVRARDVARKLRCSQKNARALIDSTFTCGATSNERLSYPPSSTDFDFDDHPLLQVAEGAYLCPPAALCGKAVLEAVFAFARNNDKNFDSRVGPLLEAFLRNVAVTRGLRPKHGDYSFGKTQSDCDFVVETNDTIVFLELKKKGLNRLSKAGKETSDISLLVDLAKSLIKSQQQALQHATMLRKHGHLSLSNKDGVPSEIDWKDQKVIRVSVSLFDCGSLHDRTTLQHILQIGSASQIEYRNSAYDKEEGEVNRMLTRLGKLAASAGEFNARHPFDDCYLLSVSQLLHTLNNSSSNESFVEVNRPVF